MKYYHKAGQNKRYFIINALQTCLALQIRANADILNKTTPQGRVLPVRRTHPQGRIVSARGKENRVEHQTTGTRISIIVPVYNTEAYLPACVESLLAQTHRDLELIFVDDGSTDGSAAILDAYAARDGRVRVIRKENGGVSSARNAGIAAATGDYIGFVDSDDKVEPTYCETLLRAFKDHPEIGVSICNRFIHGHPNGRERGAAAGANRVLSPRDAIRYAVSIGKSYEGYLWNKLFCAEIFRTEFVGGTGSGDAFDAGFIAGLLDGCDSYETMKRATAQGMSCVRHGSATQSVFTKSELEEFLRGRELKVETLR